MPMSGNVSKGKQKDSHPKRLDSTAWQDLFARNLVCLDHLSMNWFMTGCNLKRIQWTLPPVERMYAIGWLVTEQATDCFPRDSSPRSILLRHT